MKYFKYENCQYIEDANGYLPGLLGTDQNGNKVRIIIHMPDLVGLQFGNTGYVYGLDIQAKGIPGWLHSRDTKANVGDYNYVNVTTGLTVPEDEATETDEATNTKTVKDGYSKQLEFFVNAAKGISPLPAPLYQIMINQVIQDEVILLQNVKF